jgi:hypothetical protein
MEMVDRAHSHFPGKLTTRIVYNKGFIKRDFWLTATAFCLSRLHGFKSFFQTCLPKLDLIGSLKNYSYSGKSFFMNPLLYTILVVIVMLPENWNAPWLMAFAHHL